MQKEEVQQMLDVQSQKFDEKLDSTFAKYVKEIKDHMSALGEAYQERIGVVTEYITGRFDRLEHKTDKLEVRLEHFESDVVDIKYDLRQKVDLPA